MAFMIKTPLNMENISEYDGHLYFLANSTNCIIEADSGMEHLRVVKRIPFCSQSTHVFPEYRLLFLFEGKFFIIPDLAERICVYDKDSDEIRYISVAGCKKNVTNFCDGKIVGRNLYLVPCDFDCIVKIDMESEKITTIRSEYLDNRTNVAWGGSCKSGTNIFFTDLNSDRIFCLDTENDSITIEETEIGTGLSGIFESEDKKWVIPKQFDKLICLNSSFKVESEYEINISGYECGDWSVHRYVFAGESYYFLPRLANKLLSFNVKEKSFSEIRIKERDMNSLLDRYEPITNIWKCKNQILGIYSKTGEVFNLETGESVDILVDDAKNGVVFGNMTVESNNGFDNLTNFISFITN